MKRFIAICLIIIFSVFCFSACGKSTEIFNQNETDIPNISTSYSEFDSNTNAQDSQNSSTVTTPTSEIETVKQSQKPDTDTHATDIVSNNNNNAEDVRTDSITEATDTTSDTTSGTSSAVSELTIQFIDVGQADAALVSCQGQYMLIDGGNRADSDILYTILKRENIARLDYVVCTHAHEDHCGGIAGALEACSSIGNVYCSVTEYDSKAFKNFVNSVTAKNAEIHVPAAGDVFYLGDATITILGPIKDYQETNNTSIVLKVTHGSNSFLFTGDMEHDAEIDLLEAGVDVSADVLKVGHHGSSTSTSYRFLREVAPIYGVISVGKDNSYGHPHEETLSRFRDAEVQVFRTDLLGDIFCTSDGERIEFGQK